MKKTIRLTESDLINLVKRIIKEQPESRYGPEQYMSHSERQDFQSGNSERAGAALMSGSQKQMAAIHSINPHTLLAIASLASVFIPVVGPFVAAGLGMMDSAIYWKQGKKKEAAIVGLFSLLPGILKVTKLIPEIVQLGQKGMATLGSKVASGAELTTAEAGIVDSIVTNQAVVLSEAEAVAKNIAAQGANKVANKATKETLTHIAKHGLEKGVEHTLVHAAGEHGAEQIPLFTAGNASQSIRKAGQVINKGINSINPVNVTKGLGYVGKSASNYLRK
jgi:hypothetical protein